MAIVGGRRGQAWRTAELLENNRQCVHLLHPWSVTVEQLLPCEVAFPQLLGLTDDFLRKIGQCSVVDFGPRFCRLTAGGGEQGIGGFPTVQGGSPFPTLKATPLL